MTGGAALMDGMMECAEEILGMPVRLGFPIGVKGIVQLVHGPQYATGVGLVRYGAQQLAEARARAQGAPAGAPVHDENEGASIRPRGTGFWTWLRAAF
jgi:cell division protein FtsA